MTPCWPVSRGRRARSDPAIRPTQVARVRPQKILAADGARARSVLTLAVSEKGLGVRRDM
jgi:hypothetical protein